MLPSWALPRTHLGSFRLIHPSTPLTVLHAPSARHRSRTCNCVTPTHARGHTCARSLPRAVRSSLPRDLLNRPPNEPIAPRHQADHHRQQHLPRISGVERPVLRVLQRCQRGIPPTATTETSARPCARSRPWPRTQPCEVLAERAPGTAGGVAEEDAHANVQPQPPRAPEQVGQEARVAAVHPRGRLTAIGTSGHRSVGR